MRLGVPFIAPRQLGAVESNSGRLILPSVIGRTGQSGAHRTLSDARFLSLNGAADRCRSGSRWRTGQSGAHRTVRCTPDTVRCPIYFHKQRSRPLQTVEIWEPMAHRTCPVHTGQSGAPFRPLARPRVARGFRGRPLARPTVGSPDSPVHTGQSGEF
jgi:hypothetical protein